MRITYNMFYFMKNVLEFFELFVRTKIALVCLLFFCQINEFMSI